MDSNTFLMRLGLNPDQFALSQDGPEFLDGRWVYRAETKTDAEHRRCPGCRRYDAVVVHDWRNRTVKCHMGDGPSDAVVVAKARFLCRRCGRTFTPALDGVGRHATISEATKAALKEAFLGKESFLSIAHRFDLSHGYCVQLFDAFFPNVPGRPLPRVLCIDEVLFRDGIQGKYPAILYDFERREVVDVVRSRQKAWLEEWFAKVPKGQRDGVRWFVSDMYDEYARVAGRFLPNATHVVDLFHVVRLLSDAVKRLRANLMNATPKDSPEYGFMKSRWELFQRRESGIPAKWYSHAATGLAFPYHEILLSCLKASPALWEGWSCLQELLSWRVYPTWTDAAAFVDRISAKLLGSGSPLLESVGRSYRKWRAQIANGLARNQMGVRLSNGVAEGLNNQIKTLKKIANGCTRFDRFRKRILLCLTYAKKGNR